MKRDDVFQLSTIGRGDPSSAWKIVLVELELHFNNQFIASNNLPAWNGYRDLESRNMYKTGEVISE